MLGGKVLCETKNLEPNAAQYISVGAKNTIATWAWASLSVCSIEAPFQKSFFELFLNEKLHMIAEEFIKREYSNNADLWVGSFNSFFN